MHVCVCGCECMYVHVVARDWCWIFNTLHVIPWEEIFPWAWSSAIWLALQADFSDHALCLLNTEIVGTLLSLFFFKLLKTWIWVLLFACQALYWASHHNQWITFLKFTSSSVRLHTPPCIKVEQANLLVGKGYPKWARVRVSPCSHS